MAVSTPVILVVDEDAAARTATAQALRLRGYSVLESRSAREALQVIEAHAIHVRLLLTRVVLAGLSGLALAARLRRADPRARVIYMSAATDLVAVNGLLHEGSDFLTKPFTDDQAANKVAALLSSD